MDCWGQRAAPLGERPVDGAKYRYPVPWGVDDVSLVPGWIACPVVDPHAVETLRDHLYGWLGAPEPYRRTDDPHVSLFGVRVPADRAIDFERTLSAFGDAIGPWNGVTDGYHLHPSTRNPMVVSLAVPFPLTAIASPIADLLARYGGRIDSGPVTPHITLFTGGVRGEELQWARLDEGTRDRLAVATGSEGSIEPPSRLLDPTLEVTIGPPEIEWNGPLIEHK